MFAPQMRVYEKAEIGGIYVRIHFQLFGFGNQISLLMILNLYDILKLTTIYRHYRIVNSKFLRYKFINSSL